MDDLRYVREMLQEDLGVGRVSQGNIDMALRYHRERLERLRSQSCFYLITGKVVYRVFPDCPDQGYVRVTRHKSEGKILVDLPPSEVESLLRRDSLGREWMRELSKNTAPQ